MKYIKYFENIRNDIGKYVILKSKGSDWNNLYGRIIDISKISGFGLFNLYLIEILTKLNINQKFEIRNWNSNYDYYSLLGNKENDNRLWAIKDYCKIYNNKKDFNEAIEAIEREEKIDKFNV